MISDLKPEKSNTLFLNILIGIGLLSAPFLLSPHFDTGLRIFSIAPFQRNFLGYFLLAFFYYASYYCFIPKFYFTKRWFVLTICILISYILILTLPHLLFDESQGFSLNTYKGNDGNYLRKLGEQKAPLGFLFSRDNLFFQFIGVFTLSYLLRFNTYLNKVKNEKLLTEISYLKAQINPHFLFNTLNGLYALALKKSNEAPIAILKLSNLMRYAVIESDQDTISLEKEVTYIQNFIDLQKLRLTSKTVLNTSFKGKFTTYKIAPLLLINFIENAFKYGVSTEEYSEILLHLNVQDGMLHLKIENHKVSLFNTPENRNSTEIGLQNSKKQLTLLYPDKHLLAIKNEEGKFKVDLKLDLI